MTLAGAVIVLDGGALTLTTSGAEVPVQPVVSVTVTLYEPLVFTVIDCVVAPVDHRYDWPALAISVTLLPLQKLTGPDVAIAGVNAPTLTVAVSLLEQPLVSLTETDNATAAAEVAWNVMVPVPAPLMIVPLEIVQAIVLPAADGTDAEPVLPAHMLDGAVMVATGRAFAMIAIGADVVLQPEPLPTVTV